jgi:hypothetical protein
MKHSLQYPRPQDSLHPSAILLDRQQRDPPPASNTRSYRPAGRAQHPSGVSDLNSYLNPSRQKRRRWIESETSRINVS